MKPSLFRMVFNDHASEILEKYKTGKIDISRAMSALNTGVDYVLENVIQDTQRPRKRRQVLRDE